MCDKSHPTSSNAPGEAINEHQEKIEAEFKTIQKCCVYIGNIPSFVSKLELVERFSKFGDMCNIFVQPNRPHCDVKAAIVRYCSERSVKRALCLHNNEFHNSVLIVIQVGLSHSKYLLTYNTCIAVNVSDDTPLIYVYDEFEKVGSIFHIFKSINNIIYVDFKEYLDMETAVASQSFIINDRILKISRNKKNINMCLLYLESLTDTANMVKVKEYILYDFKAFWKTKKKLSPNVQEDETWEPTPGPSKPSKRTRSP